MAQTAARTATGTTMFHTPLDNTAPVVIDIGDILDRTRQSSLAVTRIVENHTRMVALAGVVVDVEFFNHLHATTASSLYKHQTDLRSLHQQMTVYAGAMDPNNTDFHHVRANAAAAIELADLYSSPTTNPHLDFHPGGYDTHQMVP